MSGLLERLRAWRDPRMNEAADEIERLTEHIGRQEREIERRGVKIARLQAAVDTARERVLHLADRIEDGAPRSELRGEVAAVLLALDGWVKPCQECKGHPEQYKWEWLEVCQTCHGIGRVAGEVKP